MIKKKIFLDTEFTGLHQNTTLISMALLADSGEEFYAEFTDYDQSQLSAWLNDHVIENLFLTDSKQQQEGLQKLYIRGAHADIQQALARWLAQFGADKACLQVWGDCLPWDWVLFCELFGGAFGIPASIHYMPIDLATLFYIKTGEPDQGRIAFAGEALKPLALKQHNALYDVYMMKACYEKLMR